MITNTEANRVAVATYRDEMKMALQGINACTELLAAGAAGCVFLLQNLSEITAALPEVETCATTSLRWSGQAGLPLGREGQGEP